MDWIQRWQQPAMQSAFLYFGKALNKLRGRDPHQRSFHLAILQIRKLLYCLGNYKQHPSLYFRSFLWTKCVGRQSYLNNDSWYLSNLYPVSLLVCLIQDLSLLPSLSSVSWSLTGLTSDPSAFDWSCFSSVVTVNTEPTVTDISMQWHRHQYALANTVYAHSYLQDEHKVIFPPQAHIIKTYITAWSAYQHISA